MRSLLATVSNDLAYKSNLSAHAHNQGSYSNGRTFMVAVGFSMGSIFFMIFAQFKYHV